MFARVSVIHQNNVGEGKKEMETHPGRLRSQVFLTFSFTLAARVFNS